MNQKTNNIFLIICLLPALCLMPSCYEHEQGCRDINALNYSVKADLDCDDDCCNYPGIDIQMQLVKGNETIDTNSYFDMGFGDSVRIKQMRVYFSDFKIIGTDSKIYPIWQDNLLGIKSNNTLEFKKINYAAMKFKPESNRYNIGEFRNLVKASQLEFIFGLQSHVNHAVTDKITESNPLYQGKDNMYINDDIGYYFLKMTLQSKKDPQNFIFIEISGDENIRPISVSGVFDLTSRKNHLFNLNLDVLSLFKGINPDDDVNVKKSKILDNIDESITLKP